MQKNIGKLLSSLTAMQKRSEEIQKELAEATFEGDAANGMVKVVVTGKGEIKRVFIDPSVMSEDSETLADLIVVASGKATDAKEVVAKQKLATLAASAMPLGIKLPGLG